MASAAAGDTPEFGTADLTNCDREPIHIPGSIQPHGVLLALDRLTLAVNHAGGDTVAMFGLPPPEMLGRSLDAWLQADQIERLRTFEHNVGSLPSPVHLFRTPLGSGPTVDVSAHLGEDLLILEFEPVREEHFGDVLALVRSMVHDVQRAQTRSEYCAVLARVVRAATRYDRVMVYRFDPDGSGVVVAEAKDDALLSFLGHHFPASDIPKQARELYLRNWIRVIPDTHYRPAPIVAIDPEPGRPLDLSQSALRSVSPIHLEYLENMRVGASMSLSLILDDKLWGLVACHSGSQNFVSQRLRVGLELFSQMASYLLEVRITSDELNAKRTRLAASDALLLQVAAEESVLEKLNQLRPKLLEIIEADGVGLWIGGSYQSCGVSPQAEDVAGLVDWLNATAPTGVFHTNALPLIYPPAVAFAGVASGVLALSLSRRPQDYVIWFRQEVVEKVTWAGAPEKIVSNEPGARLSPRKSFAAWQEERRLHSALWENVAVQTAEDLRASLLEIVLRRNDQIAEERAESLKRQQTSIVALEEQVRGWEERADQLKPGAGRHSLVEGELSEVLRSLVVRQETERQRIAGELHGILGQYLAAMNMQLSVFGRSVPDVSPIKSGLEELKSLTATVGAEVSRLAWELRPTALDDLGLEPAIEQLADQWGATSGLRFDVHLQLKNRRLPPDVETTLYRVLEEGIANIVKHAGARTVGVILKASSTDVFMVIEDDGRGFELETSSRASALRLGLLGMQERLAAVQGSLEIETSPGAGTTLIIRAPHHG